MFNAVIPETEFQDDFSTIFKTDFEEVSNSNMEYEYYVDKIEENWYEVVMKCNIILDRILYPFNASGEIQGHEGYDGEVTLMVSLDGIVTIDGEEFNLIVGFNKMGKEEYLTTTIYNKNLETVLVFGEVIEGFDEHIRKIVENIEYEDEDGEIFPEDDLNDKEFIDEEYMMANNGKYDFVKSKYGDLETSGERGMRLALYKSDYSTTSPILKIGVRSYNDSIQKSMKKENPYLTDVELIKIKVGLYMKVGDCRGTSPSEDDAGSGILKNMFIDAIGSMGVPTSALDEIFSNMRGSVSVNRDSSKPSITIKSGWAEERIYCDYEELPLFFNIQPTNSGLAEGDFYGELQYKISAYYQNVGPTSFYRKCYVDAPFDVKF